MAVSLALLISVAASLPKVPDLIAIETAYSEVGRTLSARENELRVALDARKISLQEALRVIDQELQPQWQALDDTLTVDTGGDQRMQTAVATLRKNVAIQREQLAKLRTLIVRAQTQSDEPAPK
jgi:hypothetical protein